MSDAGSEASDTSLVERRGGYLQTDAGLDDSSEEDFVIFDGTSSRRTPSSGTEPHQPNPFRGLDDIAKNEGVDPYERETDTLALYQNELDRRPKISRVLNRLLKYNAVAQDDADGNQLSAEKSMLALLRKTPVKMGTLSGVYLPTLQNILGVILFLRMGWIVGSAGVGQTLLIIAICCTSTMLTAISMSAIATNGVVPAGGAYFMISRSLGPEFGGAVGILFYLGTTFASSMYTLGAIEILLTYIAPGMSAFGDAPPGSDAMLNNMRLYGTILLFCMALIVFVGVQYVNRFASVCLVAVLMSIFFIYVGFFSSPLGHQSDVCLVDSTLVDSSTVKYCNASDLASFSWATVNSTFEKIRSIPGLRSSRISSNLGAQYLSKGDAMTGAVGLEGQVEADITSSFTILLAIFFPACTGIMAGSNRSGDLRDPSRSIPLGTIAAIATTALIYITVALFVGSVVEGQVLRDKFGDSISGGLIMAEVAWPHPMVILIGSLMSCIGAGLQSLMGAPRLLQAIAQDDLLPFLKFFGKASSSGEPTRALLLTVIIAECGILIASLDAVAPIITMFFLMCYGFVNLACSLQSLLKSPSWRPRFKYYHWGLSGLGVLLCLILMFISSWIYALVALFLAGVIYYYIEFKGAAKEWGDGIRGLSMQAARYSLLRLEDAPPHTKNWRPQILTLSKLDNETQEVAEPALLGLAAHLKGGKGLNMVASVLQGRFVDRQVDAIKGEHAIKACLARYGIQGFGQVIVSQEVQQGISYLIQGSGLGALRHNTVLVGWPEGVQGDKNERKSSQSADGGDAAADAALDDEVPLVNYDRAMLFADILRECSAKQLAVIVPKNIQLFPQPTDRMEGTIDVWWIVHDGGMLLLMAFLLRQDAVWRRCRLRVFMVAESEDNTIQLQKDLTTFLYQLRIDADVMVVEMLDNDISAYTYEKVRRMHKRQQALSRANLSAKQKRRTAEQAVRGTQLHNPVSLDSDAGKEETNLQRMNTSVKLNQVISQHSKRADLILLNLPGLTDGEETSTESVSSYLEFVEALTEGLQRVVMIRGGGREVITIFS